MGKGGSTREVRQRVLEYTCYACIWVLGCPCGFPVRLEESRNKPASLCCLSPFRTPGLSTYLVLAAQNNQQTSPPQSCATPSVMHNNIQPPRATRVNFTPILLCICLTSIMMSYESQSTSCLFRVPIEIRRAIYADLVDIAGIHISLSSQGGVRLTRCLGPDLGAENSGDERRPRGHDPDDRIWARRVASTWGPHWECEETALAKDQKGHQDIHTTLRGSFLIICKRL